MIYLEEELGKLLVRIKNKGISLQEGRDLYFEAKEKYLSSDKKSRTREASRLILKIFFLVGRISEDFVKRWQSGKLKPSDKELELLKEGCNEVLEAFDNHFKEELVDYREKSFDIHYAETKEKVRKIRSILFQ